MIHREARSARGFAAARAVLIAILLVGVGELPSQASATTHVSLATGTQTAGGGPEASAARKGRQVRIPRQKPVPIPAGTAAEHFPVERYLNIRTAASPELSPSGQQVGFLTNITGTNQVWSVPVAGGWPNPITFGEEPARFFLWSPVDENLILFGRDVGGNERTQLFLANLTTGSVRRLTHRDQAIHNFGGWSRDGRRIAYSANVRDQAFFDVYVQDLETGQEVLVLQQDGSNFPAGFSPDGRWLLVSRSQSSFDNDLYLVGVDERGDPIHLTPHEGPARYESPAWRPDSRGLYLLSDEGREFMNLATFDIDSRRLRFTEEESWDVDALALSEDGRYLAMVTNADGYGRLDVRDARTKRALKLPALPAGFPSSLAFSKDGRKLALGFTGPEHPLDVWLYDLPARKVARVTHSSTAGIPPSTFVPAELVHIDSFDGLRLSGFLYRPLGHEGDQLPVVINVHGGPEDQSQAKFSLLTQYFVNRGFAVLYPNVRGSTGYGKRFSHLDDVEKRLDSVRDLAECARWLEASGIAEHGRIAVYGGSYGGYMTLAALAFHPERWACGVSAVGISNLKTFIANTGAWRRSLRMAEYGDPARHGKIMQEASPFYAVDRIRAPLLVIQGANDPRVPQSESDQMVKAIQSRGGTVEYMLFPDEGHGLTKLPNRIKGFTKIADFMERYLLASPRAQAD